MKNTASITIMVKSGEDFTLELKGYLDNENLPLADRVISLKKDCRYNCEFAPVAPIRYELSLSSTGKILMQDTITVPIGEDIMRTYELQKDVMIAKTVVSHIGSPLIANAIMANAQKKDPDSTYKLVGIDKENIVYVERRIASGKRELGILSLEKFSPLWVFVDGVGEMTLDITGEYFVAPLFADKTLIMNRKIDIKKELPFSQVLGYVGGKEEKILTQSGIFLGLYSSYGKNPRYTDWLDISEKSRLGYIDKDDLSRLGLSGYPAGISVLVLQDRATGKSVIVKRGVDIRFLFFLSGVPVFLDDSGELWAIDVQ